MKDDDFTRYEVSSQQRLIRVLLALGGHEVNGRGCAEIARALNLTTVNVYRDLANLAIAGVAEKVPDTGQWRLSPRIPQIAVAMLNGIDRVERKTSEVRQRYTRDPG